MGCASSKQKRCRHCRHCRAPYSPMPRSYSMHVVHPPQEKGDNCHVVALTSTTLGSLPLDSYSNCKDNNNADVDLAAKCNDEDDKNLCEGQIGISNDKELKSKEFSLGLIKAKNWSNVIQEKIPKIVPRTPVRTPPGEPETINAWELMAGLEDDDYVHSPRRFRSFSFDISGHPSPVPDYSPRLKGTIFSPNKSHNNEKPLWLQLSDEEADSRFSEEFDPQIIATFRKALQDLSPTHPFHLNPPDTEQLQPLSPSSVGNNNNIEDFCKGGKKKVVLYFTSLRGIRKTHEDCCHVRVIFKGLGVRADERDVSMHAGFKEELRELMGEGFRGGGLPKVFVGRKYIGGADEIRRLHEEGQLEKLVEGCEKVKEIGGGACEACGDIRFVPCETCSGSCKIYYEREEELEEDQEEEAEEEDDEYGFQRCPDCNENGLIRCPMCCY